MDIGLNHGHPHLPPPGQQQHLPQGPPILPHPHAHPDAAGPSSSLSPVVPHPLHPTPADIAHHPSSKLSRKRKKADDADDPNNPSNAHVQPPPARRLRRLHEACARCRSKKIKCDSKLPSCSACTAASVECNQEDRHRQTLKPRGYTDMVEAQLAKCILVLEKLIPGFRLTDIDVIMDREGIHLPPMSMPPVPDPETGATTIHAALNAVLQANAGALGVGVPVKVEPIAPTLSMPPPMGPPPPPGGPMRPADVASPGSASGYEDGRRPNANAGPSGSVKGQDPQSNDLSSAPGLIKAFGVSKAIVRDLPKPEGGEGEDVLGGVRLEDDAPLPQYPKMVSQWTNRPLRHSQININVPYFATPVPPINGPTSPTASTAPTTSSLTTMLQRTRLAFRLPRDRNLTNFVVDTYFDRLNWHRPVFLPHEFKQGLNMLYDSLDEDPSRPFHRPHPVWSSVPAQPTDDPGFLCSVYLILALGRLAIDNEHWHRGQEGHPEIMKDYPLHEEFFELALAVKPDLRVTLCSLQALILLQWYLYIERHGRTLWRLVGNMVRLSIELGLHHDPSGQENTFTPAECEIRNRLWWTVLIHDRGTSVQLGRPLAIADADFNTPFPKRLCPSLPEDGQFSEHFEHSPHLTSIQGDIINALYRPGNHKQTADQIIRHASRITKGFGAFSRGILGPSYRAFFEGTENWTNEQKIALVSQMTEDQGLTLLKYGIARIFLLRTLFTSSVLSADARRRALKDAVITSHNILTIQIQLTSFSSVAFFVSPIPIHIAAMVILYGVISECDALPWAKARDDVCSALHIVPVFRWRWKRKDAHGSHPLIIKLAQKVFGEDVLRMAGPLGPPLLLPEWDWTTGQADLPPTLSPSPTPHLSNGIAGYGGPPQSGSQGHTPPSGNGNGVNGGVYHAIDPALSAGQQGRWEGNHSRNVSNGVALPPTPVSATMPNQQQPSPIVAGPNSGLQHGPIPSNGTPPDGNNYSPASDQARFDPAVKEDLVRVAAQVLYPPPLDPYYDQSNGLGLIPDMPGPSQPGQPGMMPMGHHPMQSGHMGPPSGIPMHMQPPAHGQPTQHIPPPGHVMDGSGMHPHQQQQSMMYPAMPTDYTPSSSHFVQEEYDGKSLMGSHLHSDPMYGPWS